MSERVSLAPKRVEVVGRDDPERLERRVRLLCLAEGEQGASFVFQGPRMVRLDGQDGVARNDEIGPLFGPQKEIAFRLEPIVRPRLNREETVEGRDRFLSAVQLDARVGLRVQSARMAGVEGNEPPGLPEGLVPSSEGPPRLQPAFPPRERLRS